METPGTFKISKEKNAKNFDIFDGDAWYFLTIQQNFQYFSNFPLKYTNPQTFLNLFKLNKNHHNVITKISQIFLF